MRHFGNKKNQVIVIIFCIVGKNKKILPMFSYSKRHGNFWSILLSHFIKHSKPLILYLKTSLLPLLWTLLTQSCGFCKWGHLVMIISFFSLIESSKFHRMNIIYHGGQKWMDICGRSCEELVMICFLKNSFNNIFKPKNNRVKKVQKKS